MCVIIIKEPNVKLPYDKISSACEVNADGFGVTVLKDGELLSFKSYDPKGNNPDEVYRIIQQHNEYPQFIHLRFTTKGAKGLDNTHPFLVLDKEDTQVQFMHNGTLTGFGDAERSDTKAFCETIVAPLLEVFYHKDGKDVLKNELFKKIMDDYSGNGYFVLYDNHGNYFYVGGKGYQHQGWWSSNVYSFERNHRTKNSNSSSRWSHRSSSQYGTSYYNTWDSYLEDESSAEDSVLERYLVAGDCWRNHKGDIVRWDIVKRDYEVVITAEDLAREIDKEAEALKAKEGSNKVVALPPPQASSEVNNNNNNEKEEELDDSVPFRELFPNQDTTLAGGEDTRLESKLLGYALSEAKRKNLAWAQHVAPSDRATFTQLAGINDLSELNVFTTDELESIVLQTPHAATLLIMDLLHELYRKNLAVEDNERKVA